MPLGKVFFSVFYYKNKIPMNPAFNVKDPLTYLVLNKWEKKGKSRESMKGYLWEYRKEKKKVELNRVYAFSLPEISRLPVALHWKSHS